MALAWLRSSAWLPLELKLTAPSCAGICGDETAGSEKKARSSCTPRSVHRAFVEFVDTSMLTANHRARYVARERLEDSGVLACSVLVAQDQKSPSEVSKILLLTLVMLVASGP